jgi:hypothetical protein
VRLLRLLVVVLAVTLPGCALRGPRPRQVLPASAHGLLEGLAARRAAVTTMRARARLKGGLSTVWTREAILVRRPDAVRVDVLSPFGLAVAFGARDSQLWAYPPNERTRYEGIASPANMARFLGAPIAVADVVDILLGVPPARRPAGRPDVVLTPDGEYELTIPIADGVQKIWFAADTLAVARAEEHHDGTLALRVVFGEHRDGFPHALEVVAPATGASARLVYDAVEPNAAVDPALFAPPPAARVLPLEAP